MDLNIFEIEFARLKPGINQFSWKIDPDFFRHFDNNLIDNCSGSVEVTIEETEKETYELQYAVAGKINFECGRCLNHFDLTFRDQYGMEIIRGDKEVEDEDIIVVNLEEKSVSLAPYINEFFNLHVPMRATCDLAGLECNQDMIKLYKKYQTDKIGIESQTDPRWESLKNLRKNKQ